MASVGDANEGGGNVGSTSRQLSTAQESVDRGIETLWSEFKQTGAQTLRNQLIIYYSPFVKYVASRVLAGLPRHFDEEDLVSYGIIGLIDAIERFEPERNLRFETYAIPAHQGRDHRRVAVDRLGAEVGAGRRLVRSSRRSPTSRRHCGARPTTLRSQRSWK